MNQYNLNAKNSLGCLVSYKFGSSEFKNSCITQNLFAVNTRHVKDIILVLPDINLQAIVLTLKSSFVIRLLCQYDVIVHVYKLRCLVTKRVLWFFCGHKISRMLITEGWSSNIFDSDDINYLRLDWYIRSLNMIYWIFHIKKLKIWKNLQLLSKTMSCQTHLFTSRKICITFRYFFSHGDHYEWIDRKEAADKKIKN